MTPEERRKNKVRLDLLQGTIWVELIFVFYAFVMLINYEYMNYKRKMASGLLNQRKTLASQYGRYLRLTTTTAAFILMLRCFLVQAELMMEVHTDYEHCNIVVLVKFFLTAVYVTLIYVFLWLRQRACYSNPLVHHLTSQLTHACSWVSLIMLIIAEVIGTSLFMWTRTYKRYGDLFDISIIIKVESRLI